MTAHQLTMAVKEEALEMALQAHTWTKARSKVDGRPFYLIPSRSEENVAHYTTSYGCTCRGFRRNGDCAHAEAVRMYEGHQRAEQRVREYQLEANTAAVRAYVAAAGTDASEDDCRAAGHAARETVEQRRRAAGRVVLEGMA